jgi:putative hydrolase of the HAD superfamily
MSPRPALDAVIFDAGGTLVRMDYEWIAFMLAVLAHSVTPAALRAAELAGRVAYDAAMARDGAPVSGTVYWRGMLAAAGLPPGRMDEALRRMDERQKSDHFLWAKPMEGARAALDALPGLGLRLACVSNSDGRAEAHLVRYGVREGLEFVIDSALVGIEKPDPGIFHLALERMGIPAQRALYVGDLAGVDARGSHAAGMHCVLLDPSGTYAPQGVVGIRGIADLPAYIEQHFSTPLAEEPRRT